MLEFLFVDYRLSLYTNCVFGLYRSFQGNLAFYRLLSKVRPPVGKPDMKLSSEQVELLSL